MTRTRTSRSRPPAPRWTAAALEVGGQPGEDQRLDQELVRMAVDVEHRHLVVVELRGMRKRRRRARAEARADAWAQVGWHALVLVLVLGAMLAAVLA